MNREIMFRAWETNRNKMCYGYETYIADAEQNDYPLMQFTGLKDKNGKEVFEGDILMVNDKNAYGKVKKLQYKVEFIEGAFMCVLIDKKYDKVFPKSMKNQPNMEVIGNVFENPELLNK